MDVKLSTSTGIPYLAQSCIEDYSTLRFIADNKDVVKINPTILAAMNSTLLNSIPDFDIEDCCVITEYSKSELEEINLFSWTGRCKTMTFFHALGIDLNNVFYCENITDLKVEVKDEEENIIDDFDNADLSLSPIMFDISAKAPKRKTYEKNWSEEQQKMYESYELPKPLKEFKVPALTSKTKGNIITTSIDLSKKFACHLCSSRFTSNQNLQSHLIKLHSDHYNCCFCKKVFGLNQAEEFKKHIFKHEHKVVTPNDNGKSSKSKVVSDMDISSEDKPKVNTENDQSMKNKQTVIRKKRTKTAPVKKVCEECGSHVTNLKIHMSTVHGVAKFACPQCSISFKTMDYLKTHIDWVHVKVPCSECGVMVGRRKMPRHIREKHTAMEERKFKCGTCGKGFTSNAKLRDHTNIHTGEKTYKCKFCNACFASIGNHAMHQRSHLGHRCSK